MDSLNNVFSDVVENSGLESFKLKRAQLHEKWDEIAGDDLSKHLSIHSLEGDRLILKASDPSWSHHASMLKRELQREINTYFDTELVSKIKIIS